MKTSMRLVAAIAFAFALPMAGASAATLSLRVEAPSADAACQKAYAKAKRDAEYHCQHYGKLKDLKYGQCKTKNLSKVYGGKPTFAAEMKFTPKCWRQH